jgi:hypothetical protein
VKANARLPQEDDWEALVQKIDFKKVVADSVKQDDGLGKKRVIQGKSMLKKEAKMAGMLLYLAKKYPAALNGLVLNTVSKSKNSDSEKFAALSSPSNIYNTLTKLNFNPLASFDLDSQLAVLSPMGLIDLCKEYFFELESFLGPAVGHVWVSPGSTLEVYEVHTKKMIEEKAKEISIETSPLSETEIVDQDELSTAVSNDNSRNIHSGVGAKHRSDRSEKMAIIEAKLEAKTYGIAATTIISQESAHKHARSQSNKLANDIYRNFKTSFRTSVETQDTSSRKYIIQNNTDKLVNYELRRKMRRVAVQVQHISKQSCWQVFVDYPGRDLGIAQLIHVAQPEDLNPEPMPPETIVVLKPEKNTYNFTFGFQPVTDSARNDGADEDYTKGIDDQEKDQEGENQGRINWETVIDASGESPGPGYTLTGVSIKSYDSTKDEDSDWYCTPRIHSLAKEEGVFTIALDKVNFDDNSGIVFHFELEWSPPEPSEAAIKAQKEYQAKLTEAQIKAQHAAAVQLVRERIKLASNIRMRPPKDLREEERTVIYRKIIKMLTNIESPSTKQLHLITELIRSIFDIDSMLYFVAPEWWRPKSGYTSRQNVEVNQYKLTNEDKVNWGGAKAKIGPYQIFGERPNYYITEDSERARMGSSLGWMLQLDGDIQRNILLNSPWVKVVIPIKTGREISAVKWLKDAEVEGTEGLDAKYGGNDLDLDPKHNTIADALEKLAQMISGLNTDIKNIIATEKVYETGFHSLEDGFTPSGEPFKIFDQWVEILPTDQVVAVEYEKK